MNDFSNSNKMPKTLMVFWELVLTYSDTLWRIMNYVGIGHVMWKITIVLVIWRLEFQVELGAFVAFVGFLFAMTL